MATIVAGEDPEIVDDETVDLDARETELITLELETSPLERDDAFPVRVIAAEHTAEITVDVSAYGSVVSQQHSVTLTGPARSSRFQTE